MFEFFGYDGEQIVTDKIEDMAIKLRDRYGVTEIGDAGWHKDFGRGYFATTISADGIIKGELYEVAE